MSRDVRAGGAYVELGLRAKLDKGLKKAATKLRNFGKTAMSIGAAGFGSAAGMIAPLLLAAATAQEVGSKFDTVFGNNAAAVRAWGDEFAGQVGRSKNVVAEFLSSSQDLFVPLGFDDKSAENMSKTITSLSFDLASFNNKADGDVMNDLQAALTGSGEVMKKYGVILSEAAVKQELLNQGLDPQKATNAQKVQARLNIIMRGTTAAQGDAIRTAGSFTNRTKALYASLQDLAVLLGEHLIPPATMIASVLNRGVQAVMAFADQNASLTRNILYLVGGVAAAGGALLSIGTIALGLGIAIPPIIAGVTTLAGVFSALFSPAMLVVGVIAGIAAAAYVYRDAIVEYAMAFWQVVKPIRDAATEIWSIVTGVFGGVGDAIAASDYSGAAAILWTGVKALFFTGAAQAVAAWDWIRTTSAEKVGGITEMLTAKFTGFFGGLVDRARDMTGTLATSFSGFFSGIIDRVGGSASFIGDVFGFAFDAVRDLLGSLFENFKATFGGIADALMGGNIGLAAQILWAGIQVAFISGIGKVKQLWSGMVTGLQDVWSAAAGSIMTTFRAVVSTMATVMQSVTSRLSAVLATLAEFDPTGTSKKLSAALGAVSQVYAAGEKAIQDAQKSAEDQRHAQQLARQRAHLQNIRQIADETAKAKERRDELIKQASVEGGDVTVKTLKDASLDRLSKLIKNAKAQVDVIDQEKLADVESEQESTLKSGDKVASKSKTAGTFSALGAQLLGLGGNSAAEETAENTRRTAEAVESIANEPAAVIPRFT